MLELLYDLEVFVHNDCIRTASMSVTDIRDRLLNKIGDSFIILSDEKSRQHNDSASIILKLATSYKSPSFSHQQIVQYYTETQIKCF